MLGLSWQCNIPQQQRHVHMSFNTAGSRESCLCQQQKSINLVFQKVLWIMENHEEVKEDLLVPS